MPAGDSSPDRYLVLGTYGACSLGRPEWKATSLAYSSQRELDSWQADTFYRIGSTFSTFHLVYQASQRIIPGIPDFAGSGTLLLAYRPAEMCWGGRDQRRQVGLHPGRASPSSWLLTV